MRVIPDLTKLRLPVRKAVSRRARHIRNTAAVITFSFIAVIAVGTFLLSLPVSRLDGASDLINSAFTSTSAVCITGLTVHDTSLTYTFFGQLVILLLVQIGGLGYMTVAVAMAVLMGKRLGIASAVHIMQSNGETHLAGMADLAKNTVLYTLSIEGMGAILYFVRFAGMPELGLSFRSVWYAVFHSVMSFCNAGFDLMGVLYGKGSGLSHFCGDVYFCLVLSSLVFVGGLGYAVCADLARTAASEGPFRLFSAAARRKHSTHTVIAVNTTLILVALGTVLVLACEHADAFAGMPLWRKFIMSVSESVTCRTAGFTTMNTSALPAICLHLLGPLMLIGGCPVSTGGGIKTTTVAVLYAALKSALGGKPDVEICSRRVPGKYLNRAIAVTALGILMVLGVTVLLSYTESSSVCSDLTRLQFEVISAVGTVGLSTGISAQLSPWGKLILMIAMFIGRIGSITFFNIVVFTDKKLMRRLPEDDIVIG